jgi:hypothetical protein
MPEGWLEMEWSPKLQQLPQPFSKWEVQTWSPWDVICLSGQAPHSQSCPYYVAQMLLPGQGTPESDLSHSPRSAHGMVW